LSVRLRLVRGMGWDSKFIEWGSRSCFSHAELINAAGTKTFGAQLKGGVRFRYVTDRCYRNVERWEIWEIPTTLLQNREIAEFIGKTNGLPYDWKAIVSFALGERDWREPDSWFCSEWYMRMLEVAGVAKVPAEEPVDRIDPGDLYLIVSQISGAKVVLKG
jgi:hypothetical protein